MKHYNKGKQGTHLQGTDNRCNECLKVGITMLGGEIMTHSNRKELLIKYRDTGVKPRDVVITETYN